MTAARELRRLRYLAAMGEDVFVCRRELPGALRPQRYVLRLAASGGQTPAADNSREKPQAAMPAALREQVAKAAQTAATRPAAVPQAPTVARASPSAPAERFRLAALLYAGRLWVEDLGEEALAREQIQLVASIGVALDHGSPDVELPLKGEPKLTQFDWPMHSNPQFDLGAEEARHTLQGFLRRLLQDHGCRELFALGEAAAARLDALELGCSMRVLPSTRDMLGDALAKKRAWNLLRP